MVLAATFHNMEQPHLETTCENTLTRKLKGLKNPKLIRSFASDGELEAALICRANTTGLSISAVIRASLRKFLDLGE